MENSAVKISVIVPCFNHGHYLRFALDSICAQTFTQWEAIIVDDGSTDNTSKVAEQYKERRIRYIYQPNAGLAAARNRGIKVAHGEFMAFLDADDEWESNFLATCHEQLQYERDISGIFTRCRYIDQDGNRLPGIGGQPIEPADFRQRLLKGGFFPVNAILVRASILSRSGLFDTNLTSLEDWDLWLRVSQFQSMRGISQALARYRVYPGSMSTNVARMHANRLAVLAKLFGDLDGDVENWSADKRLALGHAYMATSLGYFAQDEDALGWHWMEKAFNLWPGLLEDVDPFYELLCKDQPRGYRGNITSLDITANANKLFQHLDKFWPDAGQEVRSRQLVAQGNAHLAAAMLYDQAGNWAQARKHMLTAIKNDRTLVRDAKVRRRLVKLSIFSPRLMKMVQSKRKAFDRKLDLRDTG